MVTRAFRLHRDDHREDDLHRDAALKQIDGEYEEAFVVFDSQQDTLDVSHRTSDDPHALALFQIWVGARRYPGAHSSADRLDLVRRYDGPPVPRITKDRNNASGLADFHVGVLVEGLVEKQVAGEHRDSYAAADVRMPGPDFDGGQKGMKPLGRELVVHELLAMTPGPEHEPSGLGRRIGRAVRRRDPPLSFHHGVCQGFAPFALAAR